MRNVLICLLIALAAPAVAASQGGNAFNPKVSSREIPLNGSVRVSFATMAAQREDVDIVTSVRNALDLPTVQAHWRLAADPEVSIHPKAKDVAVAFVVHPRHVGDLALPNIAVPWMGKGQAVDLGSVDVREHVALGAQTRPLPQEVERIGGFAWGSDAAKIGEVVAKHRFSSGGPGKPDTVEVNESLQLVLHGGRLAEARVRAPGVSLAAAQEHYFERWGDPVVNEIRAERDARLVWHLGWVRITARPVGSGSELLLVHEGIVRQLASAVVKSQVFSVLDSGKAEAGTPVVEAPTPAVAEKPAAATPATKPDQPSQGDIERELQRVLSGQPVVEPPKAK